MTIQTVDKVRGKSLGFCHIKVLKIKAEKEPTSIGFDFYATVITLNENMEIEVIHQDYDVAQ